MKYYLDTEFIEGFHKPLFGKKRHFIDLISIGIVSEDGREYYAISNEFNPKHADNWVKENVIAKLPPKKFNYAGHDIFNELGLYKSNKQIALEIENFINCENISQGGQVVLGKLFPNVPPNPEFYAYYADYDWVVFCSLFGRMIDLPKTFPMYCNDLKQTLDEYAKSYDDMFCNGDESMETKLGWIKNKDSYPKQENEHSALDDAKWNKRLHEFLNIVM